MSKWNREILGVYLVSTQKIIIFFFSIFAGKTSQMLTCLILFLQEKPHKCSMCSKSFPTPGDLKSHTYVHTGTWPFKCHICHRGFSKQTNLKNHLLLHSGNFLKTAVIDNMTAVRWWLSFKPPLHPFIQPLAQTHTFYENNENCFTFLQQLNKFYLF